jgi:hypothetical protein
MQSVEPCVYFDSSTVWSCFCYDVRPVTIPFLKAFTNPVFNNLSTDTTLHLQLITSEKTFVWILACRRSLRGKKNLVCLSVLMIRFQRLIRLSDFREVRHGSSFYRKVASTGEFRGDWPSDSRKWISARTFHICSPIWMKFGIGYVHLMPLNIRELRENRRRESHSLHTGVNENFPVFSPLVHRFG